MKIIKNRYTIQAILGCLFSILVLVSLLGLSACTKEKTDLDEDITTQKEIQQGKIPITILVKYAFTINEFEKAAEKKFPQVDIIQVGNYTSQMGIEEYRHRLKNDDLTDIVMTWPLEVGEEYWSERLLELSGMDFTSKYNISMMDSIAKDGKLYYIPGPAQIRGIVYNKTLFKEKGWQVPKDFEGFLELCQTIEASGMRSLQLPFKNSETLDTAFVGYGYKDCYSKPQDSQWLEDYNNRMGNFGSQFDAALDTFQKMIDAGIFKESDLEIDYSVREKMLFSRECAMVEDSVLIARMGFNQAGSTDEFALMPFFNPGTDGDWARLYMVCYIGLNKHLAEPENKEKYDLVLELMGYISTPEGQRALAADTGAMFSSIQNIPPPNIPEIKDLLPALEHGRYAVFPQLANAQNALRKGLEGMVRGEYGKDDVAKMVDEENKNLELVKKEEVIGTAKKDFSMIETGNFVTDTMCKVTGSEIGLFLDNGKDGKYNGKGISARLYKGDLTTVDILRIMPDLKFGDPGVLWKVQMTGEDLIKTLEYAIPVENNNRGWFYYFSGIRMEFDAGAVPGSRIRKITDDKGIAIDLQKVYTVAVMNDSVPKEFLISCENTEIPIAKMLEDEIKNEKTISPSGDGRFYIVK